jgi:hypothetical protein
MTSYLLVAGLVVGPTLWFLRRSLLAALETSEAQDLRPRVEALRARLAGVDDADLDPVVRSYDELLQLRISIIDRDGVVRADSQVPSAELSHVESHAGRPEFRAALERGYGYAVRTSATTGAEYIYVAVPIPAVGPPRGVLRVARMASSLRGAVSNTLFTLRLSTGVAVSVALLLSLGAAVFISSPLRKMRDAARAFARSEWVPLAPTRTGDELETLSQALVEMGEQIRARLTAAGASEALLRQAVRALPVASILLDHDLAVLEASGALRTRAALTPDREAAELAAVIDHPNVKAARTEASRHGSPVELFAPLPGRLADEARPGLLVPLMRTSGAPWWLLVLGLDRDRGEQDDARLRALVSADRTLDALWQNDREHRPELTQLRQALDEILRCSAPLEADGVQSRQLEAIVAGVLDELRVSAPEQAARIALAPPPANLPPIADALGLAGRAVRSLVRLSLDTARPAVQIEATLAAGDTEVYLALDGGPSIDLGPVRTFCDPLGARVEWHAAEQAIRLSWPRA